MLTNQTTMPSEIIKIDFMKKYPISLWKEHVFYTEDYVKVINGHWFKFIPPTSTSNYIFALLYIFIMIFGFLGNLLVICVYTKYKLLQIPRNMWILNLAVSHFVMMLKIPIFVYNSFYQGPVLGKLGCQVYGFLGGFTEIMSSMTLVAISFDRYYAITRPLETVTKITKQKTTVWIALIWINGFLFSLLPVLNVGYSRYEPEGYLTSCNIDYLTKNIQGKVYVLIIFMITWCIPLIVILYCYIKILITVLVVNNKMATGLIGQETKKRNSEIRLCCMVIGIITLWCISWTPYAIVRLLGVFNKTEYITPFRSMMLALFSMINSCTDPWIYAITHPKFKKDLKKLIFFLSRDNPITANYGTKK